MTGYINGMTNFQISNLSVTLSKVIGNISKFISGFPKWNRNSLNLVNSGNLKDEFSEFRESER